MQTVCKKIMLGAFSFLCLQNVLQAQSNNGNYKAPIALGGSCASPDGTFKDMPDTCSCIDNSCGGDCISCAFGVLCTYCPCTGTSNYATANSNGLCYNSLAAGTYCYTFIQPASGFMYVSFAFSGCAGCTGGGPLGGGVTGAYTQDMSCSAQTYDKNCALIGAGVLFGTGHAAINAGDKITVCVTIPAGCSVCPIIRCGGPTSTSNCGSPSLPVKLLYIATNRYKNHVKLSWKTASEINNDFFLIERTLDGKYFETIARVKGSGNLASERYYSFFDENPHQEVYYFRLTQIDFDGKSEYLGMAAVAKADGNADEPKILSVSGSSVYSDKIHYSYLNPTMVR